MKTYHLVYIDYYWSRCIRSIGSRLCIDSNRQVCFLSRDCTLNKNGWLIKPSTSAVTGDTFITEYGYVDYHTKYLNTLSLHQMELDIAKWIITFVRAF